jgi:hypothetical protein
MYMALGTLHKTNMTTLTAAIAAIVAVAGEMEGKMRIELFGGSYESA